MSKKFYIPLMVTLLTIIEIFFCSEAGSQTNHSSKVINVPLTYEDLSLYDFAMVRFETKKTEIPPVNLLKKQFQPLKGIFGTDSLYFVDSVQSVWLQFSIYNNYPTDTSVSVIFPRGVNKAILYKNEGEQLVVVGKTGFAIAVIKRAIYKEDARIDLNLKAHSQTNCLLQIPRIGFRYMFSKTPVLETFNYAEIRAFKREKEFNNPRFLWAHFFTGIFFMFFVFGFIKYLVLEKDIAYLYYGLLGLFNALMAIAYAEYPAFELPWFENLRGIELLNLLNGIAIFMQGYFILEILQLKIKYPRITISIKGLLYLQLLLAVLYTVDWTTGTRFHPAFWGINTFFQLVLLSLMLGWVLYLAKIRKGFYRFIFLGALTIFLASTVAFSVRYFKLYYLLPVWFGADQRGSVNHLMQIALVIDMLFYFTGLSFRDRKVQTDKTIFQEQLIKQLSENKNLHEKFTGELEQQVKEKTTELVQQRQALETEKEAKLLADFNRRFSESEFKALRSQMNPHFVFNVLNTIESYALENNKEAASEMIQKFSKLTRLVFENSMNQLVPFENDWKALQLYIQLEQMRYADKFLVAYNITDQILEQGYLIPPMIVQPFIENAIIHGLRNKPGNGGILNLSASLENDCIIVQVEDNGIGRSKAALLKTNNPIQKNSLGIKVTQDRISMFNNLNLDNKATVEIQDLNEGTRVIIKLPATNYL
ncbi:MAG: histidine kinase [Chitinophagaceae bacterium]